MSHMTPYHSMGDGQVERLKSYHHKQVKESC